MLGLRTARFLGILLSCLMLVSMFAGLPKTVKAAATIYVPDNYPTIQSAVDAASPGDTIIVRDGTYTENVDVNKNRLTIRSENGADSTIVQAADPNDHVFAIAIMTAADYVSLSGFTVKAASVMAASGIKAAGSHHQIYDNIISDNYRGITLSGSNYTVLRNNRISNNNEYGICLWNSSNNALTHNIHSNNGVGIEMTSSNNNNISHNVLKNQEGGIKLTYSNSNCFMNNIVSNSECSIELWENCSYNTIVNNVFSNSNYGAVVGSDDISSDKNTLYLNDFIDNTNNVWSRDSTNTWHSPEEISYTYNGITHTNYLGNYWSNYSGSDSNGDGIGDTPYNIDSDKDNFPLVKPFENYAPDSFADLGNTEDEAQHNLIGWGNAQGPPDNPYVSPSGDRTKRYQILRGDNSVDLGINDLGVDYLLTTEVEDGGCTDNFEIYVNGNGPIYEYHGSNPGSGEAVIHEVLVPKDYITANRITVTFRNTSTDDCGLAAVYNVKLQPNILLDILLNVPLFNQNDPRWGGDQLGRCVGETIGSAGCATTSKAMVFNYFHPNWTDPGKLNECLTQDGGYLNKCEMPPYDQNNICAPPGVECVKLMTTKDYSIEELYRVMDDELQHGYPLIAKVKSVNPYKTQSHYVVIIGKCGDMYYINDPSFGDPPGGKKWTLNNVPAGPYEILSIREFHATKQQQEVTTSTGTGTATFSTNVGGITGLTALDQVDLVRPPSLWLNFPHGYFSFNVTGITPGSTVTVTIILPTPVSPFCQYWKCINGQWIDDKCIICQWTDYTSLLGDNDGDNILTLRLTDGGQGDADGVANGRIVDPGGPAIPASASTPAIPKASPAPSRLLNPAQMSIQYLSINPQQTYAGQPVTIATNVVNSGDEAGNYNVALKINGQMEQQRMVSVGPRSAYPVKFIVTKSQSATYTVDIGEQRGSFIILGADNKTSSSQKGSGLLVILCFGMLAMAIAIIVILARRRV